MKRNNSILCSIIVTHNRKALLQRALEAHASQTLQSSILLIVDNASTDSTQEMLIAEGWLDRPNVKLLSLPENTGGAGGFSAGMQCAMELGADWVWMMDDDAEPHPNALEELMYIVASPDNIYGSLAVSGRETAWLTTLKSASPEIISEASKIPRCAEVKSIPFLGFLIHQSMISRIGLPDPGFFIAADDEEYCIRAQQAGAKIIMAGQSFIEHPKSRPSYVNIFGYNVIFLSLPPWKRYYDTRNRILIARKYYGIKFFTHTIPGTMVRLLFSLLKEPHKKLQLRAFFGGLIDGIFGIKGKRHTRWGIRQQG